MSYKPTKEVRDQYFTYKKFFKRFPNETACEKHLMQLKYSKGFECERCNNTKFYKLKGKQLKRRHIIQCSSCKKQESITKGTLFMHSKVSLEDWFFAFFAMSQTKKGISSLLLSKHINVAHSTALMMQHKIRRSMQENVVDYQIGGENRIVEVDEIEIGGKNNTKQSVLVLLEVEQRRLGRVRFVPLTDKTRNSIELSLVPLIAKGTKLHTDGNKVYSKIASCNFQYLSHKGVAHWEENHQHEFLQDINMVIGNLKRWYRGVHHSFYLKNTAYYLNEFAYRFNRRRSEINIFDRLLKRCVERPKCLTFKLYQSEAKYQPLAA